MAAEKLCLIRERVADRIGRNPFRTWFGESACFELNGAQLDVSVDNGFILSWICANYLNQLREVTSGVLGTEAQVGVRVRQNGSHSAAAKPESQGAGGAARSAARKRGLPGAPRLRGDLDSFVVGPSNDLAFSAARNLVRTPEHAVRPLVVHGGSGLGKTHLLHGICNGVRLGHPTLNWRYVSGEEFTNEFVYAVKSTRIDVFRARFRTVDVLVIDDIHFLANKRATQEEFLHTFNAIDASGRVVVLSCDQHPRRIGLSDPLINRLISGMVVEVQPPDYATRLEIVRRRAATMKHKIPDAVLEYVAQKVTRNVRELEGALYKLAALSSLTREPLTLETVGCAIEEYMTRTQPAPQATEIQRLVALHFGVSREMIHSRSRERTVALARAVTMLLMRRHTAMSLPEIGRALGNKNHSTVLMAIQRMDATLKRNGAVSWKTPSGMREVPLHEVIQTVEQLLAASRGRPG